MRKTATAQLDQIQRQLAALPAELEALKVRGAEDIAAEEARIAETAKAEQARLLDQTRREIAMRLRIARRELTEHAAQLAVQVAASADRAHDHARTTSCGCSIAMPRNWRRAGQGREAR